MIEKLCCNHTEAWYVSCPECRRDLRTIAEYQGTHGPYTDAEALELIWAARSSEGAADE